MEVKVEDQAGNLVTAGAVMLAVVSNPAITISAPLGADGIAHFSQLLFDVAGSYQLTAKSGSVSGLSLFFTVGAAAPAQLSFVAQPGNATAGQSFGAEVKVTDQFGNTVSGVPVTIAVGAGPRFTLDGLVQRLWLRPPTPTASLT